MLKVFDKNLVPIGVLPSADQVQRRRRLNSDYGLSFLVPMNTDDYNEKIALKGHVKDERGQYYVINGIKRSRDGLKRMAQVDCTHIMFKLVDFKMPYASYIEEGFGVNIVTLTNLITAATKGKFVFSVDSVFDVKDIKDFGHGNAMEALVYIIKTYGCEVDPNNFLIHLKAQIGADNGLQYRFKKNIISNNFTDSAQGLVTRMYGEMKDGLTFIGLPASNLTPSEYALLNLVPGAISGGLIQVNYLISQYAGTWWNTTNDYYDGEHIDQNIEDQLELLKATRKALTENEVPSIDVTINAADIFKIDSTESKPNMGDTVYLIDPLMDLNNMTARVVELTEYPYQLDKHTQVTLANYMLRSYADIISSFDASKRVVDNLMSGGRVRSSKFETLAKQAIDDINNSKTEVKYDNRGILLQSTVNPLHQVVLSSDGVYITIDGGAHALAAITAGGGLIAERITGIIGNFVQMSADSIVTGALSGINMQIGSGANSFHADNNGISLGGTTWASSPFRVDMAGNAWATSMTLQAPSITNGHIVGTDINIGNGKFVVDAAGNVIMQNGSISWSTVNPPSASQVGALSVASPKLNNLDSIGNYIGAMSQGQVSGLSTRLTNITSTGVYTGTVGVDQLYATSAWITNAMIGSIDANKITAGTLSADRISTIGLASEKIYKAGSPNSYLVVGGALSDMILYSSGSELFRFEDNVGSGSTLRGGTNKVASMSIGNSGTYAFNTWDFSGATVTGIYAKFG